MGQNVLAAQGLDLSDLVKVTVHLAELRRDSQALDEAYREAVTAPYPVRTTRSSHPWEILVEIDMVAALRTASRCGRSTGSSMAAG